MDNPLGKSVGYSDVFNPQLLYPIERAQARMGLGLKDPLPFQGRDRWTCYELSWLNGDGVPQTALLSLDYDAATPMIVESKSLKLFLGSMNFTKFKDQSEVAQVIRSALAPVLRTEDIGIQIWPSDQWGALPIVEPLGDCVDHGTHQTDSSQRLRSLEQEVSETLHSNLLRSLCPVTSQPDWGTLIVSYTGRKLERDSLLNYLIAHRSYQGFHEECCERIFADIHSATHASKLWVGCFYTRRGGIDINPERWLPGTERLAISGRLARQ
jgi:7-cyano-7-deazaguanine reductase